MDTFQDFIANTKEPLLFQTNFAETTRNSLELTYAGFDIDFVFRNDERAQNEYILGFGRAEVLSELFRVSGTLQDSISVNSSYEVSSEFFFLHGGYRRVFRPDERLSFYLGTSVKLGVPVASRTTEAIELQDGNQEYEFFAKQHVSAMLTIPVAFQLKLFRNVSSSFVIQNGFVYQKLDGTHTFSRLSGLDLKINYRIRN